MLIPDGYRLVMIATAPDRPTYAEFYDIAAVLALRSYPGPLPDHPGLALPTVAECGEQLAWYLDDLRPEQVTRLNRWTAAGWVVAFRWNAGGTARIERRKATRYLGEVEIFWLRQYAETSMIWGERRREAESTAAQQPMRNKATKKARKLTAKMRRQRQETR